MADLTFRFDEAEIRAFLDDPAGPVAWLMRDLAERAAQVARTTVRKRAVGSPSKKGRPGTSAPPLSTMASIDVALHASGGRAPWSEVSADMVGLFLERGTRPHAIHSMGPWSLSNEATGYFGPVVHHPGTGIYPFLTTGLWSLQGEV